MKPQKLESNPFASPLTPAKPSQCFPFVLRIRLLGHMPGSTNVSCLTSPTWPWFSALSSVPELPHPALQMPFLCWELCWLLFLHISPSAWLIQLFCNISNMSSIPGTPLLSFFTGIPFLLQSFVPPSAAVTPDTIVYLTNSFTSAWVSIMRDRLMSQTLEYDIPWR